MKNTLTHTAQGEGKGNPIAVCRSRYLSAKIAKVRAAAIQIHLPTLCVCTFSIHEIIIIIIICPG